MARQPGRSQPRKQGTKHKKVRRSVHARTQRPPSQTLLRGVHAEDKADADGTRRWPRRKRLTRGGAEQMRIVAEELRLTAEDQRRDAETGRAAAEAHRESQETRRELSETLRASAEEIRHSAEVARAAAEQVRRLAEEARTAQSRLHKMLLELLRRSRRAEHEKQKPAPRASHGKRRGAGDGRSSS